jgi:hypothetical protein
MTTEDQISLSYVPPSYHLLTSLDNASHSNTNNQEQNIIFNRIMSILNDRLDDAQQYKDSFCQNSMQPILFDVLREIKQRNGKKKFNLKNQSTLSLLISRDRRVGPSIEILDSTGVT